MFLLNISGTSLGLMMCLDFQLFGFNLMLGLAIDESYFEYLTLASMATFFGLLLKMKLAFMAVRMQNANNPMILDRTMANPITRYAVKLMAVITIFYIASFYIMPYYWFAYYMIAFYTYGIPQIFHSAKIGSRNCFRWKYQSLLWIQPLITPIFTKGYHHNF